MTINRLKSWRELVHLNDKLRNGELNWTACGATWGWNNLKRGLARTELARVVGDERARDGHKRGAVDARPARDGGASLSAQALSAPDPAAP